jgi:hypothetical protein
MARKIAHFGGITVLNPRKAHVSNFGWGGNVTDAGVYFTRLTHQAESLALRLKEMWLAGDEKAGDLVVAAENRAERREHDRRNVLAAEVRLRFAHVLKRAEVEANLG